MPNGKELPELFEWKDSEREKMRKRGAAARLYERMTPAWYRRRRGEQVDEQERGAGSGHVSSRQRQQDSCRRHPPQPRQVRPARGSNGELLNGHRGAGGGQRRRRHGQRRSMSTAEQSRAEESRSRQ